MFPASRLTDLHLCPAFSGPAPHLGGPISTPGHATTLIGSLIAARGTDQATCAMGPPDFIVTGAGTCLIGGQPAARMLEKAMHGGVVIWGCFTVLIGGPSAGVTLGNPAAGTAACEAARLGRNPPPGTTYPSGPLAGQQIPSQTAGQSYNNCGVEASRQIINHVNAGSGNPPVSQETLLNQSMANNDAEQVPGNMYASGGTFPDDRVNILSNNGVPAHTESPTSGNMEQAVAEGRGVEVSLQAGTLWPVSSPGSQGTPGQPGYIPPGSGAHIVLVTGLQYDADGNLQNVIINDTGTGQCGIPVPAATFQQAVDQRGMDHTVTDNPIW
ncbi:MAG: PAAR domain-containing protein [Rhodothermales bacterium]